MFSLVKPPATINVPVPFISLRLIDPPFTVREPVFSSIAEFVNFAVISPLFIKSSL